MFLNVLPRQIQPSNRMFWEAPSGLKSKALGHQVPQPHLPLHVFPGKLKHRKKQERCPPWEPQQEQGFPCYMYSDLFKKERKKESILLNVFHQLVEDACRW